MRISNIEFVNTSPSYARCALVLAKAALVFTIISSPSFAISENPSLFSAVISLTVGSAAGLASASLNSTREKLTIIGIGLLANQIVIPAYMPIYSLSTVPTIFINLIGASIATGIANLLKSE